MLRSTTAFVASLREKEQQDYVQKQETLHQVHEVLNEMVYDVEIFEYECGKRHLQTELRAVRTHLKQVQEREKELQKRYLYSVKNINKISQEGNTLATNVHMKLQEIVLQLQEKEHLETLYQKAKEQLKADAKISKDLSKAQSVIRDLRRKQKLQQMMMPTPIAPRNSSELQKEIHYNEGNVLLMSIPDRQLLDIFSYLEAPDVLAIGMVNCGFRDRIHSIFGMKHTFSSNTNYSSASSKRMPSTPAHTTIATLEKAKERMQILDT